MPKVNLATVSKSDWVPPPFHSHSAKKSSPTVPWDTPEMFLNLSCPKNRHKAIKTAWVLGHLPHLLGLDPTPVSVMDFENGVLLPNTLLVYLPKAIV